MGNRPRANQHEMKSSKDSIYHPGKLKQAMQSSVMTGGRDVARLAQGNLLLDNSSRGVGGWVALLGQGVGECKGPGVGTRSRNRKARGTEVHSANACLKYQSDIEKATQPLRGRLPALNHFYFFGIRGKKCSLVLQANGDR